MHTSQSFCTQVYWLIKYCTLIARWIFDASLFLAVVFPGHSDGSPVCRSPRVPEHRHSTMYLRCALSFGHGNACTGCPDRTIHDLAIGSLSQTLQASGCNNLQGKRSATYVVSTASMARHYWVLHNTDRNCTLFRYWVYKQSARYPWSPPCGSWLRYLTAGSLSSWQVDDDLTTQTPGTGHPSTCPSKCENRPANFTGSTLKDVRSLKQLLSTARVPPGGGGYIHCSVVCRGNVWRGIARHRSCSRATAQSEFFCVCSIVFMHLPIGGKCSTAFTISVITSRLLPSALGLLLLPRWETPAYIPVVTAVSQTR